MTATERESYRASPSQLWRCPCGHTERAIYGSQNAGVHVTPVGGRWCNGMCVLYNRMRAIKATRGRPAKPRRASAAKRGKA